VGKESEGPGQDGYRTRTLWYEMTETSHEVISWINVQYMKVTTLLCKSLGSVRFVSVFERSFLCLPMLSNVINSVKYYYNLK